MKNLFSTLLLATLITPLSAIEPGEQSGFWLETSGYTGTHFTDLHSAFEDFGDFNVSGFNIYIGYMVTEEASGDFQSIFANVGIARGNFSDLSSMDNDLLDPRYNNYTFGYRMGSEIADPLIGFFQVSVGMSELKLKGLSTEEISAKGFILEFDLGLKCEFNDHFYMTATVGAGMDLLDLEISSISSGDTLAGKQLYLHASVGFGIQF